MTINELKTVLPILMKHNIVPILVGDAGIGKTQIVKSLLSDLMGLVHLHLATQEPGDIVGLLEKNPDGRSCRHLKPEWFPTEGSGIVFLDEFNRMHPDVMQAMMSFPLERKVHTHVLPEGWKIIAAGNYNNERYNVLDTNEGAWLSRFCYIDVKPTVEEFIVYAESKNEDSVAAFIRAHPEMLEVKSKSGFDFNLIKPTRRTWLEFIAPLDSEPGLDVARYETYCGLVGPTAAASYIAHKQTEASRLSGKMVLNKYSVVREKVLECSNAKSVRFDYLNTAVDEISTLLQSESAALTEVQITNFKQFILDVPLELGLKIVNMVESSLWSNKGTIVNNVDFVNKFKTTKLNKKGKGK